MLGCWNWFSRCLCVFLGGGLDVGFFSLCFVFLAGKLLVNDFFSLQNVGKAENWGII